LNPIQASRRGSENGVAQRASRATARVSGGYAGYDAAAA